MSFPSVWDHLEALIAAGRGFFPRECHEELKRKDDDLERWVSHLEGFVVQPEGSEVVPCFR